MWRTSCPCAHASLPVAVQNLCRAVAVACLSCHACMAFIFALVGAALLALLPSDDRVWDAFVHTKTSAFVSAIPTAVLMYALLRQCEAGEMRARGEMV